ncbi:polymeric immunoglobulin receptor-like isoform X2 [Sander lucioperca]|uniref:polymeric immunoglobulin receptor-like isoform X2 n=1 Tax=Sander lucioperca TaxID=283035 RepID=UPI001653D1F7|nr:polymeric immunoglobulin receptor-like isoform X2 [Sander lucioperca]
MSTLTSAPHVAFFMLFWILSLAADHPEVPEKAGDDVTLQCQAPRDAQINMLEWSRPDLESDPYIFRFIPGESTTRNQHSSYHHRVNLSDPEMKGGDLSVVLKNVSVSDTGTYRCRVGISGGGKPKVYSTIQLIVSDLIVEVPCGDNATLQFKTAYPSISDVNLTRPDLKPDTIFCYNNKSLNTDDQNPSFKDRVELVDRDLKDGDVSLTLKNVNINDTGTYECHVRAAGPKRRRRATTDEKPIRTISIIRLQVTEPGARGNGGLAAGVVFLVAAVAAVVGGLMYKRRRDNRPKPPAADEAGDTSTPLTT